MGLIYLIRHAQAGTRDNYDTLSELGRQQAKLLGEHLASQGVAFSSMFCGNMRRQRLTAEAVCKSYQARGVDVPDVRCEDGWNEFNLAFIYQTFAARLQEEDEGFARDFQEMEAALRLDPHATRGATGRCDAAMIRAWMQNRYPDFDGEPWSGFRQRILACAGGLSLNGNRDRVAIFTSATPIAILAAAALDLSEDKFLSILGVVYNSSVTVLQSRDGSLRLITFNSTTHLPPDLQTFR